MYSIHSLNEIDPSLKQKLIEESNAIEGIFPKVESVNKQNRHLVFAPWRGHAKGLEYVLENYDNHILNKDILEIHRLLSTHLLEKPGEYRLSPIYIASKDDLNINFEGALYYKQIPKQMRLLIKSLQEKQSMNQLIKKHYQFEMIHPFVDFNGRTGRLILNWTTLQQHKKIIIFNHKNKHHYYHELQLYKKKYIESNNDMKFYKSYQRVNHSILEIIKRYRDSKL